MTTGAHPPEIEAQQQLITGLLRWLLALDSDAEWTERRLTVQPTASGQVRYALVERRDDGDRVEADLLPDGVAEAVRLLQQHMYSPTGGAWLTGDFSVTSAGQGDACFGYDQEPRIPAPDGTAGGMSPDEVAAHLQTFPRPSSAVPDWMVGVG